jgi:hypothetical protein
MKIFRVSARSLIRRLSPVLGVILLAVLFVGGIHHHADGSHEVCVACAASHSPAVTTAPTSPAGTPTDHYVALAPRVERVPHATRHETTRSRAPPSA